MVSNEFNALIAVQSAAFDHRGEQIVLNKGLDLNIQDTSQAPRLDGGTTPAPS